MDPTRREFFVRTGCAALGMAAFQAGLDKLGLISAYARPAAADYRALVCVFLGGGNDGNSMIVPLDAYPRYLDLANLSGVRIDLDNADACAAFTVRNVGLFQRHTVLDYARAAAHPRRP